MKFTPSILLATGWWALLAHFASDAARGHTPLGAALVWVAVATLLVIAGALALVAAATVVAAFERSVR